jgi:excisionase family DNA binding protein
MPKENAAPLTYTVEEVAELLQIGRNHCYEACASGQIPSIRIGRRLLIPRVALGRLLENGRAA